MAIFAMSPAHAQLWVGVALCDDNGDIGDLGDISFNGVIGGIHMASATSATSAIPATCDDIGNNGDA